MTQRNLSCAGADVVTSAPRETVRRKPTRNPRRLEQVEIGRVVTLRVVVTGDRAHGDKFCRAIAADGSEGEPCTLPGDWACSSAGGE